MKAQLAMDTRRPLDNSGGPLLLMWRMPCAGLAHASKMPMKHERQIKEKAHDFS